MLHHWRAALTLILVPLLLSPAPASIPETAAPCWGDVNSDAKVDVTDAQLIGRFAVGMRIADGEAMMARGDVTGDGRVNVSDAQQVARYSVGLPAPVRLLGYNTERCSK